jgi:hypothetical protein
LDLGNQMHQEMKGNGRGSSATDSATACRGHDPQVGDKETARLATAMLNCGLEITNIRSFHVPRMLLKS